MSKNPLFYDLISLNLTKINKPNENIIWLIYSYHPDQAAPFNFFTASVNLGTISNASPTIP